MMITQRVMGLTVSVNVVTLLIHADKQHKHCLDPVYPD